MRPLPSAGSSWGEFPVFSGTMSRSDSLRPHGAVLSVAPRFLTPIVLFAPSPATVGESEKGPGIYGSPECRYSSEA